MKGHTADIRRMTALGRGYLADADLLQSSLERQSDGAYLLRLTAFEILLKAVLRSQDEVQRKHHRFAALFEDLHVNTRERVLERARSRYGPEADLSNPQRLLAELGRNFVDMRYSYEKYDGLSETEYQALGAEWTSSGAADKAATFRYYQLELDALIQALNLELSPDRAVDDSTTGSGAT